MRNRPADRHGGKQQRGGQRHDKQQDSSPVDTFLTLFVAEIQNQDRPTRLTPPNISTSFLRWRRCDDGRDERAGEYQRGADEQHQVMALGNLVGDDIMVQTTAFR